MTTDFKLPWRYFVIKETVIQLDNAFTTKTLKDFYSWLNGFDDFAGRSLLENLKDLQDLSDYETGARILAGTRRLLTKRVDQFIKEKNINPTKEFMESQRQTNHDRYAREYLEREMGDV